MSRILVLMVAMLLPGLFMGSCRAQNAGRPTAPFRIHTLFSVERRNYFDWQTVGLMHSYRKALQPGPITRLLFCTDEEKRTYKGMNLAPTLEVPSMSKRPNTGDRYPAINRPAGIVHWLKHSKDAENADWVVILDADMIIRGPIIPWELGAEIGRPVAAHCGYLVGCDNALAKSHRKHPELCDNVGRLLAVHIDDLRALAPIWLSKTQEVRQDGAHWVTNYTGDIYGKGRITEMYGYSFAAAEVGLHHKMNDNLMVYPGYSPPEGIDPILMHYGLPFSIGNWSFGKLEHHQDNIVYDCWRLFPEPPYMREVEEMESERNRSRALFLGIECVNTLNEGLLLQHAAYGCPRSKGSKHLSSLMSKTLTKITQSKQLTKQSRRIMEVNAQKQDVKEVAGSYPKIHTIFSAGCSPYFDWQTVGLVHSFYQSGQPGTITRLLCCKEEDLKQYKGHDLAPTHYVPSMSRHPITGDWYPAINKPAAVVHWINHIKTDAEYIVILDADMIMRGPITPWEFNAAKGRPVSTPYDNLIGCENELAKIHTRYRQACSKVGGVVIMQIRELKRFALLWLHKTEQVRADMAHWSKNITGDIYEPGWNSQMYGYSFAAAELNFRHVISNKILIYPGHVPVPGVKYRVFHYSLEFRVGNWSFNKANWTNSDMINKCWAKFPDPPDPSTLDRSNEDSLQRDLLSIECVNSLNEALQSHHQRKNCPEPSSLSPPIQETPDHPVLPPPNRDHASEEITVSRKLGKIDKVDATRHNSELRNESQELSPPEVTIQTLEVTNQTLEVTNQTFTSVRSWIVGLLAFSILSFVAVMMMIVSNHRGQRKRGKALRTKRRTAYQDSGI
ncbi:Peptidyl serine alpha-galactosyltransferase [Sesamum alatum]|uniref:Peptidyl serine alpha-galactosyltransferase n=1 Tax=Sesamum alatum TaxID=300844 RepID=A0AAE1Y9X0_9LAMI|nr:Peptidyl serine alpha-galactosyltransferase [Sesamum alatum]